MSKTHAKRMRNGFVRVLRAETAINCYTRALGFVLTRDRDQAIKMLEHAVDNSRAELQHALAKREERKAVQP
jgi:hypothetical protein